MARYQRNGYYNDPSIGQAFSNLTSMFAPPDGSDAAGWATANATNQKAQRLADFFKYSTSPGATQEGLDARGVASGTYAPNQSYYSVDQGNATDLARNTADNERAILTNKADNQRALQQTGMEQEGQTYRKKLDPFLVPKDQQYFASPEAQAVYPGLQSSGVNLAATEADNVRALQTNSADNARAVQVNTADNDRALQTNSADNDRALQERRLQEEGLTFRKRLDPIVAGENQTLYLSPELSGMLGQPGVIRGNVSLDPGEQVIYPQGGRVEGLPKPLSETEKTAEILGTLSPEDQRNRALQGVPVETVQRADGTPEIVNRTDAVGRTPASPAGTKLETQNYLAQLPDGNMVRGTAYFDQGQRRWIDTVSGQPVAPTATFSGQLSSGESAAFGGATQSNITTANNLKASATAFDMALDQYESLLKSNPGIVGTPGFVRGAGQNAVQVLSELQQAWGDQIDANSPISLDQVKQTITSISGNYDPNIQLARVLESEIAYRYAQMQNPSGEVSRQAFERALETIKGGVLPNNASALAGVSGLRQTSARAKAQSDALLNPQRAGQGTAAAAATAAAPASTSSTPSAPAGPRTIQTPHGTVTIQRVQ